MSPTRCAVGLLTYNGAPDVEACVGSLLAQAEEDLEICWIDNGSTDATVAIIQEKCPDFGPPIRLDKNIGFCAGHNRAFAATSAPYYLALNQDVVLASDYLELLCDWMDENPDLAAISGLLLHPEGSKFDAEALVASAGMAMGRGRFPFELHMGKPPNEADRQRRFVPAVTGAAILLRRDAIERISGVVGPFAPEFFAYFEEVDLALRIARAGMLCGVEGRAIGWHRARGEEGRGEAAIRTHYLKNHWLVSLRNDSLGQIFGELPQILRGEILHYVPRYFATPLCGLRAIAQGIGLLVSSRREYWRMEKAFPGAGQRRDEFYDRSREILRESK